MYSENSGLMFIGFIWAFIVALLILILVCIIIHFLIIFKYFMQPYWIWNEFSGCFHQFVSLIFSIYFSQFEQLKKKKKLYWFKKVYFLSLLAEKEIRINIPRFGIWDWWNYPTNSLMNRDFLFYILDCIFSTAVLVFVSESIITGCQKKHLDLLRFKNEKQWHSKNICPLVRKDHLKAHFNYESEYRVQKEKVFNCR